MRKILGFLAAAVIVFVYSTPSSADVTEVVNPDNWREWENNGTVSLSVSGSIAEGRTFTLNSSGTCPATHEMLPAYTNLTSRTQTIIADALEGGSWLIQYPDYQSYDSLPPEIPFQMGTAPITAGAAGTSKYYAAATRCTYTGGPAGTWAVRMLRSQVIKVTFETPIDAPVNFSVFPQAAGSAFATWGVASGATRYTVTADPGGQSCTTTDNFCVISELTNGSTYSFSVVGKNGNSTGAAASIANVVLSEPVTVGVGLIGGAWRVGNSVAAQYVLQGSTATPTITWHRCDNPISPTPTPPTGACSVAGSGANYVLVASDVGKYITAHVFVTNNYPQGQMTASSNQAVLASGAVAPPAVADPAGKPTVVNIPNPIVSVAGGTQVTITGTGLAGVTAVTVGGLPAIVVSKTDTTLVVQVPISTKVGLADLTITNAQGSVTSKSAIVYTANPVIKITKTKSITGFTSSSKVLSAAQKLAVQSLITANPTLTQLSCAAKTNGVAASKSELAKAKSLATATCTYAKTLKKTLLTIASASQSLPKAKASRTVLLTLKN